MTTQNTPSLPDCGPILERDVGARIIQVVAACIVAATAAAAPTAAYAKAKCLFISSYHQGYAWSDGVERGLRLTLGDQCEVRQFDMDTKRNKSEEDKQRAAQQAKALVERWKPDVVITADDNAAKYVIKPFFKDHDVPFVFSGVNWTAKEYGFPYSNVTGIVEVAPVGPMLRKASELSGNGTRAFYLGANTLTEGKNLKRFQDAARELGFTLGHQLVGSTDEWLTALELAQGYDFIVLGSNSGIKDWNRDRILSVLPQTSKKFTTTNHGWMMPYAMFGMTKVPEEHGEWGGKTALAILGGATPSSIPIVANRKWDIWANKKLLKRAGIELPLRLRRKVKTAR